MLQYCLESLRGRQFKRFVLSSQAARKPGKASAFDEKDTEEIDAGNVVPAPNQKMPDFVSKQKPSENQTHPSQNPGEIQDFCSVRKSPLGRSILNAHGSLHDMYLQHVLLKKAAVSLRDLQCLCTIRIVHARPLLKKLAAQGRLHTVHASSSTQEPMRSLQQRVVHQVPWGPGRMPHSS